MTDIPRELDDIRSRMRTLEGAYRRNDRQSLLQRIGGGATPRELGYDEPRTPRMAMSSGFVTLGNVQAYHGQANLMLDPTMETLEASVPFTTVAGTSGYWKAHYVVNSGDPPTSASIDRVFERAEDPDNNPFNSVVCALALGWDAADVSDTDVYFYPVTDFSPSQVPVLPYLVAAVRFYTTWAYLQSVDDVTVSIQLVDPAGPTVIVECEPEAYLLAEQWQCSTSTPFEYGDWLWRVKVHIVKEVTPMPALLNIGIAEPQLNFTYTPDPTLFQPELGNWKQITSHDHDADYSDIAHVHDEIPGQLRHTGVISPTIGASQNDWNPTGLAGASVIRIDATTPLTLTGIAAQPAGTRLLLLNITTNGITLSPESGSSSAANRFTQGFSLDGGSRPSIELWYDGTSSRWRLIGYLL